MISKLHEIVYFTYKEQRKHTTARGRKVINMIAEIEDLKRILDDTK